MLEMSEGSGEQAAMVAPHEPSSDSADGTGVSPNNIAKWHDDDAVKQLIHLRKKELLPMFESTTMSNTRKWEKLAQILASKKPGAKYWTFTWKQCESKWKDLQKNYNRVKDNMGAKSTGETPVRFRFFEDMDEVGKNSPTVKPLSTASNMDMSPNSDSSSSKSIGSNDEPPKKKTKLEKKYEELQEAVQTKEEEKEAARERRHQEMMRVQLESIAAYKDIMGRLLEKL
ncbi:uncharacterized protein LOC127752017 [Frankliniella occidentalis]|uniref:Uncharacterized protein LOC127752017 n=1 Tax=Frankliniella occidentalis TaxID=133901 RepID=A0A9C6XVT5_FRAOC|nr:uncharacterized protein LOC127752017 [Frankliniella occidentalis]